jgi:hypothetical protein
MALWTARQAAWLPTLEDSARWLSANPGLDPFGDGEALARESFGVIYGLAHHAFGFLVRRHGVQGVIDLMEAMRQGASFEVAFEKAWGLTPASFQREVVRWLTWRGFRGSGGPLRAPEAVR